MKLFEPGRIGRMNVKNRIIMAAMGVGKMADADGKWGEKVREYYVARARGGTGLITTSLVFVSQKLEPFTRDHLNLYSDSHLESLYKVVEEVHQYGAKVSVQLTAGFGRVIGIRWQQRDVTPISASAIPCHFTPQVITRSITTEEVQELVHAFGAAAARCKVAGVDAIELHGHEGYLLDQFMTGLWNQRNDKYGGSREKRLAFAREAIATIKERVGEDLPVIYRFGIDHYLEGARSVEESLWIAKQLETMGIDALHVDAGCYETYHWPHPPTSQPPGCMVALAEMVKKVVNIPVMAVGKLGYPELAEKALQEGKADFIVLGRALLADPEWPSKVLGGRLEDIRPCIGDHDGCLAELQSGKATSCTTNPACGHEKEWALTPIKERGKSVLVIGGGPGGMEAARVAALRGHKVTLWEKGNALGGSLIPASVPDFKQDYRSLIEYLSTQIKKLGITVELGKEATPELVQKMRPEVVFVATGADPIIPDIPGVRKGKVATAVDLLLGKKQAGQEIVVAGGGLVGSETALYLAQKGKKVTIVEVLDSIAQDMYKANRTHLLELLDNMKVDILTDTNVLEVRDEGVIVADKEAKRRTLAVDTVVIALGSQSNDGLFQALRDVVPEVYAIGDCVEPRKVINAIWDGFHTARKI